MSYVVLDIPEENRSDVNEQMANSVSKVIGYNIRCLFIDVSFDLFDNGVEVPVNLENIRLPSEEDKAEE